MIRWIIVLLGVSTGSSLTQINHSKAPTKNDTADSYLPQFDSSSSGFKPKRQLDDFEFDASTFDGSSVFPIKKINGLTSFDDEDTSDYSAVIPSPSFKVTRSNSDSLGIHNQNYDTLPKYDVKPQSGEQQENYSNENQPNTALNSQLPATFYKPVVQQPKYVETNNIFSTDSINVPFNSYPAMTEYTFSIPIYSLKQMPVHPIASSYQQNQATTQNLPYKTIFGQGLKTLQPNTKVYAPLHRHNSQQQQPYQAQFQNFAQNPYDIQFTTASTAEINNKKLSLPIVQLQSAQDGYIQGLETMPVIFSTESGLQYKNEPAFSIPFDFTKTKNANQRSGSSAPFLSQPTLGPIQVLPLQTASSTANFPKYKGASVSQFNQKPFSKIPNDYQEFKTQTQLHFGGNPNNNNNNINNNNNNNKQQQIIHKPVNAKPLERIRTDVEVIDKKKPIPPLPKNDDDDEPTNEDESGEGYENKDDDDDVDTRKHFKESELEGDFKPSRSYPFKEYEEKYSKPLKKTSNDDDDNEDDTDVDLAAKYRYLSNSEDDDDDDENESAEDKPRSKYKSYPIEDSYKSYNNDDDDDDDDDKDEEESRKQERKEKSFDFEREHPRSRRGKPRKERRKAIQDEVDESIKKKQSKPKYSQYRPRGSNEFNSRPRSHTNFQRHETPVRNAKRDHRRPYRDETGEPLHHASKSTRHFSPETHFEGPSSSDSPLKFASTRSPSSTEDSYRPKKGSHEFPLDDGGQSTYSKEEAAVTDSYGNPRKSTTSAPLPHPARSPKTTGDQRTSWKSSGVKTKPILVDSYNKPASSGLRALVQSKPSYFASDLSRDDILRRLKGI